MLRRSRNGVQQRSCRKGKCDRYVICLQQAVCYGLTWAAQGSEEQVVLEMGKSYIVSHPCLEELSFVFHEALGLLICRRCETGVPGKHVIGHVNHQHNETTSSMLQSSLYDFCVAYRVRMSSGSVVNPAPGGPPVECIELPVDGFRCEACGYCSKAVSTLQAHIRSHSGLPFAEMRFHPTKVQRLLRGAASTYFEVSWPKVAIGSDSALKDALKASFSTLSKTQAILPVQSDTEKSRFLKRMGWDECLGEMRLSRNKRASLLALKAKVGTGDDQVLFESLDTVVADHLREADRVLSETSSKLTYERILLYGDAIPAER